MQYCSHSSFYLLYCLHHVQGVPQTPQIHNGNYSQGEVILEVSTMASGKDSSGFFKFKVRAQNEHTAAEEIHFSLEAKDYVDGEVKHLQLAEFPSNKGHNNMTHIFYVSCQNSFGKSNESEPLTMTVLYSSSLPGNFEVWILDC